MTVLLTVYKYAWNCKYWLKSLCCGQTIKSVIDAVRTETHEINCCVFLQSKLAQVQQTSCFNLKVAWTSPQRCPEELHCIWWLCSPLCPQFWSVFPLRALFILGNKKVGCYKVMWIKWVTNLLQTMIDQYVLLCLERISLSVIQCATSLIQIFLIHKYLWRIW